MVRDFTPQDYDLVCGWWKGHQMPPPPLEILPPTGYVSDEAAVAWIYLSNAPIAWIGWTTISTTAPKEVRSEALDKLLKSISAKAKAVGTKFIFADATNQVYCNRLKKHGFIEGDKKSNHFIKGLF